MQSRTRWLVRTLAVPGARGGSAATAGSPWLQVLNGSKEHFGCISLGYVSVNMFELLGSEVYKGREHDNGNSGIRLANTFGNFSARHLRHSEVQDHRVHLLALKDLQPNRPAIGEQHPVSDTFEKHLSNG